MQEQTVIRDFQFYLKPTFEQKCALHHRFKLVDNAYNEWAQLANQSKWKGASYNEIENRIRNHIIYTETPEERYAIQQVRQCILALTEQLCRDQISLIHYRNPNRAQKTFACGMVGLSDRHLVLPGIGAIAMEQHRNLPQRHKHHFAIVVMDCYGADYYVDLVISYPTMLPDTKFVQYDRMLGLDYAQDGLYVTHKNEHGGYPCFRQQSQAELERHYQAAKRFRMGSRRWCKHMQRAAKLERRIMYQRKDWQYKKAHELAKQYDAVSVENIDWKAMRKSNPSLTIKANDNAGGQFYHTLAQVFALHGKIFVRVDRYFPSSQICSGCGARIGKLPLGLAQVVCPICGMRMSRDHNAARNIRDEGFRQIEYRYARCK